MREIHKFCGNKGKFIIFLEMGEYAIPWTVLQEEFL